MFSPWISTRSRSLFKLESQTMTKNSFDGGSFTKSGFKLGELENQPLLYSNPWVGSSTMQCLTSYQSSPRCIWLVMDCELLFEIDTRYRNKSLSLGIACVDWQRNTLCKVSIRNPWPVNFPRTRRQILDLTGISDISDGGWVFLGSVNVCLLAIWRIRHKLGILSFEFICRFEIGKECHHPFGNTSGWVTGHGLWFDLKET